MKELSAVEKKMLSKFQDKDKNIVEASYRLEDLVKEFKFKTKDEAYAALNNLVKSEFISWEEKNNDGIIFISKSIVKVNSAGHTEDKDAVAQYERSVLGEEDANETKRERIKIKLDPATYKEAINKLDPNLKRQVVAYDNNTVILFGGRGTVHDITKGEYYLESFDGLLLEITKG